MMPNKTAGGKKLNKQPCSRDCKRRAAGCAATCPDWADYVKERDARYERRLETVRIGQAIEDGIIRMGWKGKQR